MAANNFNIGAVLFNSAGMTRRIQLWNNHAEFDVDISRDSEIKLCPQNNKRLPIKLESKLRRLIKDFDKLGKKSVDL